MSEKVISSLTKYTFPLLLLLLFFLMDEWNFYSAFPPWPMAVQNSQLLIHIAAGVILLQ